MYCKDAQSISVPHMKVLERLGEKKRVENCWAKLLVPFLRGPCVTALLFPSQKPFFGELRVGIYLTYHPQKNVYSD